MDLYLAGSKQPFEYAKKEREDSLVDLYLAGDYIFGNKMDKSRFDVGYVHNRLLSYDYQKNFCDEIINKEKTMELFLAGMDKFGLDEKRKYMELFLAGASDTDRPPSDTKLLSYGMQQTQNSLDKFLTQLKPPKLFIDSGAFSAWTKGVNISTKDYIHWLNDRAGKIDLCGQVDVIPGDRVFGATPLQIKEAAEGTLQNYLFMRERLENPNSLLYTFHVGEPLDYLKRFLNTKFDGEKVPYMALGGMVGKPKHIRDKFLNSCFSVIKNSPNPDIKVHAFGMTDFDLLQKYPITSADSTSWIMVGAMGNIITDYGNITFSEQQKNNKEHYSHLPKTALDNLEIQIVEKGFSFEGLSNNRNDRIMWNALYMKNRADNLIQREFKPKKSLF